MLSRNRPQKALTLNEHYQLGVMLRHARQLVTVAWDTALATYPKSQLWDFERALKALDQVRCRMDAKVFKEHPQERTPTLIGAYYGPPVDKEYAA